MRWWDMGNNNMTEHIIFYSVTYRCYNYYILFYVEERTTYNIFSYITGREYDTL